MAISRCTEPKICGIYQEFDHIYDVNGRHYPRPDALLKFERLPDEEFDDEPEAEPDAEDDADADADDDDDEEEEELHTARPIPAPPRVLTPQVGTCNKFRRVDRRCGPSGEVLLGRRRSSESPIF